MTERVIETVAFYRNRETGARIQTMSKTTKNGRDWYVTYRDVVSVGKYFFTENMHAIESTEFNIKFGRI